MMAAMFDITGIIKMAKRARDEGVYNAVDFRSQLEKLNEDTKKPGCMARRDSWRKNRNHLTVVRDVRFPAAGCLAERAFTKRQRTQTVHCLLKIILLTCFRTPYP